MAKGISETAFASQVEDLLKMFQWRWCHFRPALTGAGWRTAMTGGDPDGYGGKGLHDYIAVRPPRLVFAELKDEVSELKPEQAAWREDLMECVKFIMTEPIMLGNQPTLPIHIRIGKEGLDNKIIPSLEVYLWRPSQIDEIAEILR